MVSKLNTEKPFSFETLNFQKAIEVMGSKRAAINEPALIGNETDVEHPLLNVNLVYPKVSIITVTYNAEKFLQDCIYSVVKQRYPNIEHIIVDGNSTDSTVSIIRRNEHHFAAWISEPDRGMYDAINKGIEMASGDVIGILNSDDMLQDEHVITEIAKQFHDEEVGAVYGNLEYVSSTNSSRIMRIWRGKAFKRSRFATGWMPAHPTFYIRKELIETHGGYENHYYTAADYEFMARYLYTHKVNARFVDKMFVKMRAGGQSNRSFVGRLRANRRDYLAMKKNNIPFPFLVSVLKPLSKLHQFYKI